MLANPIIKARGKIFRRSKENFVIFLLILLVIVYFTFSPTRRTVKICSDHSPRSYCNDFNPPHLDSRTLKSDSHLWQSNPDLGLKLLSQVVQQQIADIQDPKNCEKNNILCGHYDDCGFACQVHHRAACLMISYAMGLPLIHDVEVEGLDSSWPYSTPWTEFLLPIGSSCEVGPNTYNWTWYYTDFYPYDNLGFMWEMSRPNETKRLQFPLYDGIVVSSTLADLVEKLHPRPTEWWISQFIQYAMRLQPQTMKLIREDAALIGLRPDCIGVQIRRTDKYDEDSHSFHKLSEYFKEAKKMKDAVFNEKEGKKPQVLLASDDSSLLSTAQEKYPEWEVVGFSSNQTLSNPIERRDFLYDIVRDVLTLTQCRTVICGFSSNVCRLIYELQITRDDAAQTNLISLEYSYLYLVHGAKFKYHDNKITPNQSQSIKANM